MVAEKRTKGDQPPLEAGGSHHNLTFLSPLDARPMNPPIDTKSFQLQGASDPEDEAELAVLEEQARNYVGSFPWSPPIQEMLLAYGVGYIFALFLVRFTEPIRWHGQEDAELWIVVGDLPPAYFATDDSPNRAEAMETYCVFMEDWADRILDGDDLEGAYPIRAAPSEEHARMLKSRIEFIREKFIPEVQESRHEQGATAERLGYASQLPSSNCRAP